MFHNSSFGSGPGASLARTPARSMLSAIHNDENAHAHAHANAFNRSFKKSGGGGLGLKLRNSNTNMNGIGNGNRNTDKTPLKKASTSTRRRALGDISNRKGTGSGNGNGMSSKDGLSSKTGKKRLSIYTPHKPSGRAKSVVKPAPVQIHQEPVRSKQQQSAVVKKKFVSFAILSEPKTASTKIAPKLKESGNVGSLKKQIFKETIRNPKSKTAGILKERRDEVEDIELSAGRTGDEEQKLLADAMDGMNISSDIEETINLIRDMRAQDKMNHIQYVSPEEDPDHEQAILNALNHIEDVDDDILESHLMFDEYNEILRMSSLSVSDNEDEGDLIAHIDDISI